MIAWSERFEALSANISAHAHIFALYLCLALHPFLPLGLPGLIHTFVPSARVNCMRTSSYFIKWKTVASCPSDRILSLSRSTLVTEFFSRKNMTTVIDICKDQFVDIDALVHVRDRERERVTEGQRYKRRRIRRTAAQSGLALQKRIRHLFSFSLSRSALNNERKNREISLYPSSVYSIHSDF